MDVLLAYGGLVGPTEYIFKRFMKHIRPSTRSQLTRVPFRSPFLLEVLTKSKSRVALGFRPESSVSVARSTGFKIS